MLLRRGLSPNYILLPSYKIDSSSLFFLQLTVVDNKKNEEMRFFPAKKENLKKGEG